MTTWNMRITCWLPKAAITISLCNILGFSTAKKGPKNAPHCYFTTTLPFSLVFCSTECQDNTNYIHEIAYDTALCLYEIAYDTALCLYEIAYDTALCLYEILFSRCTYHFTPTFTVSILSAIVNKIVLFSEGNNYSESPRLYGNPKRKCRAYE